RHIAQREHAIERRLFRERMAKAERADLPPLPCAVTRPELFAELGDRGGDRIADLRVRERAHETRELGDAADRIDAVRKDVVDSFPERRAPRLRRVSSRDPPRELGERELED